MKKNNTLMGILLAVFGLGIVASIIVYGFSVTAIKPKNFAPNKSVQAEKLYLKVMEYDFNTGYPKSAEEVIELYCDTMLLLTSDMIINDSLYEDIILIQRKMLSEELLSLNSYESQYDNLIDMSKELRKSDTYVVEIETGQVYFDALETNKAIVPVRQFVKNIGNVYWNYYLVNESYCWKINTWEQTDENYKSLAKE